MDALSTYHSRLVDASTNDWNANFQTGMEDKLVSIILSAKCFIMSIFHNITPSQEGFVVRGRNLRWRAGQLVQIAIPGMST